MEWLSFLGHPVVSVCTVFYVALWFFNC